MPVRRIPVSREQFGEAWPLTVDEGWVYEREEHVAVFQTTTGKRYGLTGRAMARGLTPIDEIRREHPDIPGTWINVQPLIDIATGRLPPPAGGEEPPA